jgi:hypothetical protein
VKVAEFGLVSRARFFTFRAIFVRFGQFRLFLGPDFSLFVFFPTSSHGILARRTRG